MGQAWIEGLPELLGRTAAADPLRGYLALALVMLLENLIPPIPSELLLPCAGYLVGMGSLQLLPTLLAALLGTVLGAVFWYGVGRLIPQEALVAWLAGPGRWLGLEAEALERSRGWFLRHGGAVVFWGRLIPGVRTLVSVPAGFERMPLLPFLAWTLFGSLIWSLLLILAGQALGQGYGQIQLLLAPWAAAIETGLLIALAAGLATALVLLLRRLIQAPGP